MEPLRDSIPLSVAVDLVKRHQKDEVLTHGSSAKRFIGLYVENVRDISGIVNVGNEIPLLCHNRHKARYCSFSKSAVVVKELINLNTL